jgi:surface protein
MFYNCTNLNSINVNFSAWNPSEVTSNWVYDVSSSGTFTCPADLPEEFGTSRIPTGWTVVRK